MAVLYDCAAADTFTPSAYDTAVRYGGQPVAGTFFLFLPPGDIASRSVFQPQLGSLL